MQNHKINISYWFTHLHISFLSIMLLLRYDSTPQYLKLNLFEFLLTHLESIIQHMATSSTSPKSDHESFKIEKGFGGILYLKLDHFIHFGTNFKLPPIVLPNPNFWWALHYAFFFSFSFSHSCGTGKFYQLLHQTTTSARLGILSWATSPGLVWPNPNQCLVASV